MGSYTTYLHLLSYRENLSRKMMRLTKLEKSVHGVESKGIPYQPLYANQKELQLISCERPRERKSDPEIFSAILVCQLS
jgi:aminopeptidase-like protein